MSDLIQLGIGERPWLPTPTTRSIEVFDRYDMPITGLVEQDGSLFIYDCLEGHVMQGNIWIYANVSEQEAKHLREAEGDAFAALLDAALEGRCVTAALAIDGHIRSGVHVDRETVMSVGLMQAVVDELKKGIAIAGEAKLAMLQLC